MMQHTVVLIILSTCLSVHLDQGRTTAAEAERQVPRALFNYVQRDEPVFDWKLTGNQKAEQGTIYDVELTSQQWQGIVWKHVLMVYEPQQVRYPNHVLLFVTGGSNGGRPGERDFERGMALARLCSARVAVLHQVPNQPLLDGRKEDDLITETWLRYLDTGDENWPLLFPMVKSAVKAMDAIQQLAQERWQVSVEGFVITGGSKRGWTSWLTPVVDRRVIATAPMVIDVLNFRAQMQHQRDTWGKYSEQIHDYSSKGLIVEGEERAREAQLRRMMDPYTYREQLTLPKLMINGTNDPYWVVDAMRWYWDDLKGPKYVLQIPNAGHGLEGGQQLVLSTLAAFFQQTVTSTPLPQLQWEHTVDGDTISLRITSSAEPKAARLWTANSVDKDFRDEQWESKPLEAESREFVARTAKPAEGYVAQFVELQFEFNGLPYSLCTRIHQD